MIGFIDKQETVINDWQITLFQHPCDDLYLILIHDGPKNVTEIKRWVESYGRDQCIIYYSNKDTMIIKSINKIHVESLENEYSRIKSIIESSGIRTVSDKFDLMLAMDEILKTIPYTTKDFVNRGLFSTHYLKKRIFADTRQDLKTVPKISGTVQEILSTLGYHNESGIDGIVSVTITNQKDFSIREGENVAPSHTAISTLKHVRWAILTNGTKFRLYSSRISASSTNYFEVNLDLNDTNPYLWMIFTAAAFQENDVDHYLEEGERNKTQLEEELSDRIMGPRGLLLDMVKGILKHDMVKIFDVNELDKAKETALSVLYRIWFIAYAESRNLLPIHDEKYDEMSLGMIRRKLGKYKDNGTDCWDALLNLFAGIRRGSPEHNLPQYNGNLFSEKPSIDGKIIENRFIVPALQSLLETDGSAIDYADLGVRHLGNIFEGLMEYNVMQASDDMMLLNEKNAVKTKKESSYSYKKNDLYLVSKEGVGARKLTASYYTPAEIVQFLVRQGLDPILKSRERKMGRLLEQYKNGHVDRQACIDCITDIRVLDPAMGSGHFLVEALNQLTLWATNMLERYKDHPLSEDIMRDRDSILEQQRNRGISIEDSLLSFDVLLKRRIMKRCIFGVDINTLAVDLTKVSLWLDSFAIGVPLTYMDHHIKHGDSTMGVFLDDIKDSENDTLDDWVVNHMEDVAQSPDITIEQVRHSEDTYNEHMKRLEPTRRILDAFAASRIDGSILPKKGKESFIRLFGNHSRNEDNFLKQSRKKVNDLVQRHHFFHWELEFSDSFTSPRRGFDVIVGNPPWKKNKMNEDKFFSIYDPEIQTLNPNTKKKKRINELRKDPKINHSWDVASNLIKEKSIFYKQYKRYSLQKSGDRDLWKILTGISLGLTAKNGFTSIVISAGLCADAGIPAMRKAILDRSILSLYVFENREKIFPIHTRKRFVLLTVQNSKGPDEFPAGFYLHKLASLNNKKLEKEKFGILSRNDIMEMSPQKFIIPEVVGNDRQILQRLYAFYTFGDDLEDGWSVKMIRGFDKTGSASLQKEGGNGWPVYEVTTINQYTHLWSPHKFVADSRKGLQRMSKVKALDGRHVDFYDGYQLVFRQITGATNTRTCVAGIIPPHTFTTNSLRSLVFYCNDIILVNNMNKMAFVCGVLNSLTFDFTARAQVRENLSSVIPSLPFPPNTYEKQISHLVAKMVVGTPEFEAFAESMRVPNVTAPPPREN